MGFSRQESWSELPFPSPGHLPDPGIEPVSSAFHAYSLQLSHWGSPETNIYIYIFMYIYIYVCVCVCSLHYDSCVGMGFPDSLVVKNPPANEGDAVHSLGQEDALEKEMATHSRILVWAISRTEEPKTKLPIFTGT